MGRVGALGAHVALHQSGPVTVPRGPKVSLVSDVVRMTLHRHTGAEYHEKKRERERRRGAAAARESHVPTFARRRTLRKLCGE